MPVTQRNADLTTMEQSKLDKIAANEAAILSKQESIRENQKKLDKVRVAKLLSPLFACDATQRGLN